MLCTKGDSASHSYLMLGRKVIEGWLLASLVGCASPLVHYEPVVGEDYDGKSKFQLAESVIKFDYGKNSAGLPITSIITITSVPTPSSKLFAIAGTKYYQNWGVDTKLQVSYRSDTTLLQELGVEITDRRTEFVQGAAQVFAGIATLMSIPEKDEKSRVATLPNGLDMRKFLSSPPDDCIVIGEVTKQPKLVGNNIDRNAGLKCSVVFSSSSDFTAELEIDAVPKDAVPVTVLDSVFESNSFFYSACRPARVSLKDKSGQVVAKTTLSVADSDWLQTLKFPDKGKITVQPSCGANAVASDAKLPTAIEYVNALIAAAKTVKESLKE